MPTVPKEVILEQYQLKSTFFAEKLNEMGFFHFAERIGRIISNQSDAFAWDERTLWGITDDAWEKAKENEIHPLSVFCHPKILRLHPKLLRYYRCVALLPQKGLSKISGLGNVKEIENGTQTLNNTKIPNILTALNEQTSTIISLTTDIDNEKLSGMMYATAGTTIDGSWRNQIGEEGERVIRSLLLKSLLDNMEIMALVDKKDRSYKVQDWTNEYGNPIASINSIKSITVNNGSVVFFSSEPDVQFLNNLGAVVGAMEIKAGIDPAGALERLGAMFKSFDNVLSVSPKAKTILVATCITDEVEARLRESNDVSQIFITTDVINNKGGRGEKLANSARSILGLIPPRK